MTRSFDLDPALTYSESTKRLTVSLAYLQSSNPKHSELISRPTT